MQSADRLNEGNDLNNHIELNQRHILAACRGETQISKFRGTTEFTSLVPQTYTYLGTNDTGQKAREEWHLDHSSFAVVVVLFLILSQIKN